MTQFIKAQPKGEEGALLTNGRMNFLYVESLLTSQIYGY